MSEEMSGERRFLLCQSVHSYYYSSMLFDQSGSPRWVVNEGAFRMMNRDSLQEAYTGSMNMDSSRCGSGGEITTYDSLNPGLGQARNNLYIAVKRWASFLALRLLLDKTGETETANRAECQAKLCAETVAVAFREDLGYIPALFEDGNQAAIIPAVEAMSYPVRFGDGGAVSENGPYGALIKIQAERRFHYPRCVISWLWRDAK